jgi:acyl carrier protein
MLPGNSTLIDDRFDAVVREVLQVGDDVEMRSLRYGQSPGWDSVAHLQLVLSLEDAFGISIRGEDVLEMADYGRLRRLLKETYGVPLDG